MPGTLRIYTLSAAAAIIDFVRYSLFGESMLWSFIDSILLFFVSVVRLFSGCCVATGIERCRRPEKPLILYEFEGCPFCRKVRETLSVLAIDHYVYPCPRETLKSAGVSLNSRHRPLVLKQGGFLKFPFLIDPNVDRKLYESDDIIRYLWENYGSEARAPLNYTLAFHPFFLNLSMKLCMFCRPCLDMGMLRASSRCPEKPLELWGYESSSCVRRVREILTMLELPYMYHELPLGATAKRKQFEEKYCCQFTFPNLRNKLGLIQLPLLKDLNTNVELFGSLSIARYLRKKYQTANLPMESWMDYGVNDAKKNK